MPQSQAEVGKRDRAFESKAGSVLAMYMHSAKWVEKTRSGTVVIEASGFVELVHVSSSS